jgi:hypothetical protein
MKTTTFRSLLCALPFALLLGLAAPAATAAGTPFPTPEAAMEAFASALQNQDDRAKRALFGADYERLIPPLGDDERYRFWAAWARSHAIRMDGDRRAWIAVGDRGWTLPIPLVKTAAGWHFDTAAGEREIAIRRIGRNELAVIDVMRTYVRAQREYAALDPDGDGVKAYARHIRSSQGKRDGLYWPTAQGEAESPLGPLVADAAADGRHKAGTYHGYRYRILTAQGPAAEGGALDYIVNGRMTGGFALIAWPVEYGKTGVMTFMVSDRGIVFQRDLGPGTERAAKGIARFDPGAGWTRVDAQ